MYDFATIKHGETNGWSALLHGLRIEFASDDIEVLAAQFLDAEEDDFRWENRVAERGLGLCEEETQEAGTELDRVAILGCLAGRWYAGIACVDGDGRLWAMHGCTRFGRRLDAERAFESLH